MQFTSALAQVKHDKVDDARFAYYIPSPLRIYTSPALDSSGVVRIEIADTGTSIVNEEDDAELTDRICGKTRPLLGCRIKKLHVV